VWCGVVLCGQTGGVTTSRRWVIGIVGVVVVAGLVVAAVVWGRDGVEAASWLAGVASLLVAVVTLLVTVPSGGPGSAVARVLRFRGRASGDGQVFQAGGNITNAGNRTPKR
jgi:peptidoglycan/LPS O-acetylase OafA/YrhL